MAKKLIRSVIFTILGCLNGIAWAALALHFDWCSGPNRNWNLAVVMGVSVVCYYLLLAIFTKPTPTTT